MMKLTKKFIAIMLTLVFVLSMVPTGVLADTTGEDTRDSKELNRAALATTRGGYYTVYDTARIRIRRGDHADHTNTYHSYLKFDFSGLEKEIMCANSAAFSLQGKENSGNTSEYTLTILSGGNEDWEPSELHHYEAKERGMHTDSGTFSITQNYSGTSDVAQIITSDGMIEGIKQALNNDPGNSVVVIRLSAGPTQIYIKSPTTTLSFSYDTKEVPTDAEYLASLCDEISWSSLSSESQDEVTDSTKLPLKYKGAKIEWESSNPNVVNPDTGVITQSRSGDCEVTLSATLKYAGETMNVPTLASFPIKVAKKLPTLISIPVSGDTYIDNAYPDFPIGIREYKENGVTNEELSSWDSRYIRNRGIGVDNDSVTFFKWDLSEYEEILDVATKLTIKLKNRTYDDDTTVGLTVLKDGYEAWTSNDLTYNQALSYGLYTDPGYYTEPGILMKATTEISSPELLNAIKTAIASNPDDGVVSFRAVAEENEKYARCRRGTFTMEIEYFPEDVLGGDAFVASKIDSMPWSFVSEQDKDNIIADLTLPESFYGAPVTWSSNDEKVISSSGEVTVGSSDQTVTLTATVTDSSSNIYTKDFIVTVPANVDYILNSTKADYVNAYVWAKEACSQCALVVATYVDGELTGVKVCDENFELKKGKNFIWTNLPGTGSKKTVKVMLLENMKNLKPMVVAK